MAGLGEGFQRPGKKKEKEKKTSYLRLVLLLNLLPGAHSSSV